MPQVWSLEMIVRRIIVITKESDNEDYVRQDREMKILGLILLAGCWWWSTTLYEWLEWEIFGEKE
jgi:hypothetical protein